MSRGSRKMSKASKENVEKLVRTRRGKSNQFRKILKIQAVPGEPLGMRLVTIGEFDEDDNLIGTREKSVEFRRPVGA